MTRVNIHSDCESVLYISVSCPLYVADVKKRRYNGYNLWMTVLNDFTYRPQQPFGLFLHISSTSDSLIR